MRKLQITVPFFFVFLFFVLAPAFAQDEQAPAGIVNNEYYLKSLHFTEQARNAYDEGDYDASTVYAGQAAEYARLSDLYVAMRLAENAILKAHSRYTWAGSSGAAARYPQEYAAAGEYYQTALSARDAEDWDAAKEAAEEVIALLANIQGGRPVSPGTLPAQYTVRLWHNTGDSFSAIAGWSWVYGDPYQWRTLYEANREKLPNPANPHLILPGMIIDIPSLKGERRSGMWNPPGE